ncbi:MAG: hypothetical protein ACOY37_09565 [Pseudomonadota bacterium]
MTSPGPVTTVCPSNGPADALNAACRCSVLEVPALRSELTRLIGADVAFAERHAHLFSPHALFLERADHDRIASVCRALHAITRNAAYVRHVMQWAPAIAREAQAVDEGVIGIDFHLTTAGPRVIEINTNPGGLMLNAYALDALQACCVREGASPARSADIIASALDAWLPASRAAQRVAIVDERPVEQFLYPEFLLYRRALEARGIDCVIADPSELAWTGRELERSGTRIDSVYNRLTDFDLSAPSSSALRAALISGSVHISPTPRAHALYADKRDLAVLSDAEALGQLGVPPDTADVVLGAIPRTHVIDDASREAFWAARDRHFFKPASGYGSRGSYRGDKLTRRTWEGLAGATYVAQELVPPSRRVVASGRSLKVDVRAYAVRGEPVLLAARLYEGQTTNMRTPGGGFAPVLVAPD